MRWCRLVSSTKDIMGEEYVKKTQDSLGKIIKKPPMSDKLLKKPPFRFLHDIFTEVNTVTWLKIEERKIVNNLLLFLCVLLIFMNDWYKYNKSQSIIITL